MLASVYISLPPPLELCDEEMEIFKLECEQNTALTTEGVTMDPAKPKTLQKWPTPKNTRDLMSCNSLVAIVTRLWVGRSGVEPLQGQGIYPIQWAPVVLSSEVKRPEPEGEHSSPPSANIKSHTSIPLHMRSWCAEGNFSLTF